MRGSYRKEEPLAVPETEDRLSGDKSAAELAPELGLTHFLRLFPDSSALIWSDTFLQSAFLNFLIDPGAAAGRRQDRLGAQDAASKCGHGVDPGR